MEANPGRIEMRFDPATLAAIDDWREGHEPSTSRAEAVRTLLATSLERAGQPVLTDGEQLILVMLCELYKRLKVRDGLDPEFIEDAVTSGHHWALGWQYGGVFHTDADRNSTLREVLDILETWWLLESGYRALSPEGKAEVEAATGCTDVTFIGFDGNNEGKHHGIALFLIDRMDRFQIFAGRGDLDSHWPVLDGYLRMAEAFRPMRSTLTGRELTTAEIALILNAGTLGKG